MPPIVLTFAASDPTGGAGLQADLLTLAALGCHPLSVLTGVTVQDTSGVELLEPLGAQLVERQARRVLAESKVAAFKIGVVASADNARAIAGIGGYIDRRASDTGDSRNLRPNRLVFRSPTDPHHLRRMV